MDWIDFQRFVVFVVGINVFFLFQHRAVYNEKFGWWQSLVAGLAITAVGFAIFIN